MTVSNERTVIDDEGQSYCNVFYGKFKVHCKDSVHCLHGKSLESAFSVQHKLNGSWAEMLKIHEENQTQLVYHHVCK